MRACPPPSSLKHTAAADTFCSHNKKVDLATLDYHYYLPVLLDGARERQDPVRFLAIRGTEDLLAAGSAFVLWAVLCVCCVGCCVLRRRR